MGRLGVLPGSDSSGQVRGMGWAVTVRGQVRGMGLAVTVCGQVRGMGWAVTVRGQVGVWAGQ